jgi:hypothetical protein
MMARNKVVWDSINDLTPVAGGQRRTIQIVDLVHRSGLDVEPVERRHSEEDGNRVLQGLRFYLRHRFPTNWTVESLRECGFGYLKYRRAFTRHVGPKLLVWERTWNYGSIAPYVAKDHGFRVVAFPQNLESLVAGQFDPLARRKGLPYTFEDELKRLALADAVVCISREEQWLLHHRGISADYLPYYPTRSLADDLLEIRARRRPAESAQFLIMGSAANIPVKVGMIELLSRLRPIIVGLGVEVHVVGVETETLRSEIEPPGMTFHGRVSDDILADLAARCRAALILQKTGAGALTRIPELLIAGLPVVANGTASRSAYHYQGIHLFESDDELADLMRQDLPSPPVPDRPVEAEARVIDILKKLSGPSLPKEGNSSERFEMSSSRVS